MRALCDAFKHVLWPVFVFLFHRVYKRDYTHTQKYARKKKKTQSTNNKDDFDDDDDNDNECT